MEARGPSTVKRARRLRSLLGLGVLAVLAASIAAIILSILARGLFLTVRGFAAVSLLTIGLLVVVSNAYRHYVKGVGFKPGGMLAYLALAAILAATIVAAFKP